MAYACGCGKDVLINWSLAEGAVFLVWVCVSGVALVGVQECIAHCVRTPRPDISLSAGVLKWPLCLDTIVVRRRLRWGGVRRGYRKGTIRIEEIRDTYNKRWGVCGGEKEYQENGKDEKGESDAKNRALSNGNWQDLRNADSVLTGPRPRHAPTYARTA
jgi:hypothetical protein